MSDWDARNCPICGHRYTKCTCRPNEAITMTSPHPEAMTDSELIQKLTEALATVLGDAEHGQNMTWTERCQIGRAALAHAEAHEKETAHDR